MSKKEEKKSTCGIVMPISAIDGCSEAHWADVRAIISDAVTDAGFEPNLVSDADDVGIIQKRIIQNLYDNPVVVCDVSGKNPNVMFELGMRLAFDKPTIIIKDDVTSYSFDTSPIEHLGYPRDLRFTQIVDFKARLADKIAKTHERATSDSSYTTFLKHFGEFKVAIIDKKEVSGQEYILEELRAMRQAINRLESRRTSVVERATAAIDNMQVILEEASKSVHDAMLAEIAQLPGVLSATLSGPLRRRVLSVNLSSPLHRPSVYAVIRKYMPTSTPPPPSLKLRDDDDGGSNNDLAIAG